MIIVDQRGLAVTLLALLVLQLLGIVVSPHCKHRNQPDLQAYLDHDPDITQHPIGLADLLAA